MPPNMAKLKLAHRLLYAKYEYLKAEGRHIQEEEILETLKSVWSDRTNRKNAFDFMFFVAKMFTPEFNNTHVIGYSIVNPSTFDYTNLIEKEIEYYERRSEEARKREEAKQNE